ncbi:hypothetical protein TNCV_1966031 [Trichonephila clavipes]|nr:hypothetical protein TNCV_1966031 [Trichonephila clavipes]
MAGSSFLPTDLGREDNVEMGHPLPGALQSTTNTKTLFVSFKLKKKTLFAWGKEYNVWDADAWKNVVWTNILHVLQMMENKEFVENVMELFIHPSPCFENLG